MTRRRMFLDINCVDAARQRIRHVYDTFDTVCVQFSGGKDSTACLFLAKEIHENVTSVQLKLSLGMKNFYRQL